MFKRVLIVDDSLAARMIIKQYLEIVGCAGAQFIEAPNGKEALDTLKNEDVDLIVTDMNMPVMDGYQFIRRLKASPKWNRLPLLIISSAANKDNQEKFMKFGANFVISKPVQPNLLNEAIHKLAEKHGGGA